MEKQKKNYYVNVVEANVKDEGKVKMAEVLDFNFRGHHDLAAMVENAKKLGLKKDKHVKEFILAMRFMHHVNKKNSDNAIFAEFGPQFEAFKKSVKAQLGCECQGEC